MMAVKIANGLSDRGFHSYLCVTREEGALKNIINGKVGYCFLNKKRTISLGSFLKLKRYIVRNEITHIHAHSSSFFIASIMKLLMPKIVIVWHDHYGNSESLENRPSKLIRFLSRNFKAIISVNSLLKKWAEKSLHFNNVLYIPNFASIETNYKEETSILGESGFRICCLANLRPQKDHINLIEAFKVVHQKYPNWTLHLVGMDFKDEYSSNIRKLIEKYDLSKAVFLYGSCNDVSFILSEMTIGVLSSSSEGLPLALLEYGLAKLPVVVTNVGECSEVVTYDNEGLIVPPNNSYDLANSILKLISDINLRSKLALNLNKKVLENYSKKKYLDRIIKLYHA